MKANSVIVGFADDDGTGRFEPANDFRVFRCNRRIAPDDRAGQCRFSGNVEQILDRDDPAVQCPVTRACRAPRICGVGFLSRRLFVERHEGAFTVAPGVKTLQNCLEPGSNQALPLGHMNLPQSMSRKTVRGFAERHAQKQWAKT